MELTKSDLHFVLSRTPKDVLRMMRSNAGKLYIAGGFIRATIAGEHVSDIDLFGTTKEHLQLIAKDLTLRRKGRYFETKNALTVLTPTRYPVQFITRWLYSDARSLLNSFDFTIAQSVIWCEVVNPDEEVLKGKLPKVQFFSLIADNFYADLAAKRLTYTSPVREEEAGGSMMRVIKFIKRGYNIQAYSLAAVMTRIFGKVILEAIPKDNGFSHEENITAIVTGLLREVDPMIVVDGVDFLDEHEVLKDD